MAKEALILEGKNIYGATYVKRYGVNPKSAKKHADELFRKDKEILYVLITGKCYVQNFHKLGE
jgi:hypothetical protein